MVGAKELGTHADHQLTADRPKHQNPEGDLGRGSTVQIRFHGACCSLMQGGGACGSAGHHGSWEAAQHSSPCSTLGEGHQFPVDRNENNHSNHCRYTARVDGDLKCCAKTA